MNVNPEANYDLNNAGKGSHRGIGSGIPRTQGSSWFAYTQGRRPPDKTGAVDETAPYSSTRQCSCHIFATAQSYLSRQDWTTNSMSSNSKYRSDASLAAAALTNAP